MLPSVRGERVTVVQISYYTAITVLLTLVPFWLHYVSWIYLASAGMLNIVLVRYCAKLYVCPERPQAKHLFHYSMLYLALLFLAMALDHNLLHV